MISFLKFSGILPTLTNPSVGVNGVLTRVESLTIVLCGTGGAEVESTKLRLDVVDMFEAVLSGIFEIGVAQLHPSLHDTGLRQSRIACLIKSGVFGFFDGVLVDGKRGVGIANPSPSVLAGVGLKGDVVNGDVITL